MVSRRRLLETVAVGASLGLAGCLGGVADDSTTETPSTATDTASPATGTRPAVGSPGDSATEATPETPTARLARRGIPGNICEKDQQAPGPGGIAAVIDPAFARDWASVSVPDQYTPGRSDGRLAPESVVIGVTDGDRARAYPIAVLWWHEIVNDTFGEPTLVTYCPLCRSGLVARRVVAGAATRFTVTELLWTPPSGATADSVESGTTFGANFNETEVGVRDDRGNLVMIDAATGSYWSQLLARAICGPQRGERLSIRASRTATWRDWQVAHPDTDVLLPPPHSGVSTV